MDLLTTCFTMYSTSERGGAASARDPGDSAPFMINPGTLVMTTGRPPSAVFSSSDPPAYTSRPKVNPLIVIPVAK